jgi:transposase-like protein
MNAIPHREQQEVVTELAGIWKQERKEDTLLNLAAFKAKYQKRYPEAIRSLTEDEEHLWTFYAFPPVMHRSIRSTNAIESFFSNVRQRTDQIDAFATETSCLTIVWAVMQDIHLPNVVSPYERTFQATSLSLLTPTGLATSPYSGWYASVESRPTRRRGALGYDEHRFRRSRCWLHAL